MKIKDIAKIAYEFRRAYEEGSGEPQDFPLPQWDDCPYAQRLAQIGEVIGYFSDPSLTVEELHDQWMDRMIGEGWSWGSHPGTDRKEHPYFLPYAELPPQKKAADLFARRVILLLLPYLELPDTEGD